MKTLFTAFKGVHNTSFQLVSRLGGSSIILTNSLQGLEKEISSLQDEYNTVYMFGVDKTLIDKVRIETCASFQGETLNTAFDVLSLEKALRNSSISYTVSNEPTYYLCNAAYYYMLKKDANSVFIHIPSKKGMTDSMLNKLILFFRIDNLIQENHYDSCITSLGF